MRLSSSSSSSSTTAATTFIESFFKAIASPSKVTLVAFRESLTEPRTLSAEAAAGRLGNEIFLVEPPEASLDAAVLDEEVSGAANPPSRLNTP